MPQSLAQIVVHIIFSTKNRKPFLTAQVRSRLYPYLGATLDTCGCHPIRVGGADDHVHVLCSLSKNIAACQLLEDLKTGSSAWVKTLADDLRAFSWQRGYSIFSVSPSLVLTVARYIENQEEHHKKASFEDEFRAFLKRHGIAFDERYVWD